MGRFNWLEFPPESDKSRSADASKKVDKYDPDHYMEVANRYFDEGDFDKALRYYSRVLHLDRNNVSAWVGQSKSLIKMNELHEAKTWVEKALQHAPDDPELLSAKAHLLLKSGFLEEALALSDSALKGNADSVYVWTTRAEIFIHNKNKELSSYCFLKALELPNKNAKTNHDIGEIYLNNGFLTQALEMFNQAVEAAPSIPLYWLKLGETYEKLGMTPKAAFSYKRALEAGNGWHAAANRLAGLKYKSPEGLKNIIINNLKRIFQG